MVTVTVNCGSVRRVQAYDWDDPYVEKVEHGYDVWLPVSTEDGGGVVLKLNVANSAELSHLAAQLMHRAGNPFPKGTR